MIKRRIVIIVCALIGAIAGAAFGALAAPTAERYTATVDVALIPGPNLTTAESSSFWEVLTRGQITRTAAIVYEDWRWLKSAAEAANVRQSELTITAGALPETTVLTVNVTANSPEAAEAALSDVLITAAPQVASVTAPFQAKALSSTQDSAYPVSVPRGAQFTATGALAGLLAGGSMGWYFLRRRRTLPMLHVDSDFAVESGDTSEDTARHGS